MKKKFNVTGMTCSACAAHVEKAVEKVPGTKEISVNLLTGTLLVDYSGEDSDIIKAVEGAGYGAYSINENAPKNESDSSSRNAKEARNMRTRLIVSLVFMVILMYVAMGHMIGAPLPSFLNGTRNAVSYALVQLLLCVPILYANRAYFINGFKRLFKGAPNMDTLVAVGSGASLVYGVFALFRMSYGLGAGDEELVERYLHSLYFESSGMILALVTVGKYLETLSKKRTGDALDKLRKLVPDKAIIWVNGEERITDSSSLKFGDIIVIKAGMSVPADAVITEGSAFLDESALSGESVPVEKGVGADIIGGTYLKSGYLRASVKTVGSESVLAKIIRLVEDAGADKAPIAKIADKVARVFVPAVMAIALLTFAGWMIGGESLEFSLTMAISVLVISCPCALGLATPVAVMVGTGKGAENGVLIKSGEALETLSSVKYVVFDKTGTLTEGRPEIAEIILPEAEKTAVLAAVAALEAKSEHPLGEAIVEYAKKHDIALLSSDISYETLSGRGIRGEVSGARYAVGNARLMQEEGIPTASFEKDLASVSELGQTPLLIARNGEYLGLVSTRDKLKPNAVEAVRRLRGAGTEVYMLTGDNKRTAAAVGKELGLDGVIAEVLPDEKEREISRLCLQGKVAMVGDGINDAPALTRADVGIAIGSGSDIAVDSADIVLIKDDPMDVFFARKLSAKTILNIKENLFWAFFYNVLGIPIAAGVLYMTPIHLALNPMIGALAMSLSSIFVVSNALRLKFFKMHRVELSVATSEAPSAPTTETPEKDLKEAEEEPIEETKINDIRSIEMKEITVKVEGMMCMHCVAHVKEALVKVNGVSEAEVSLSDKKAIVKCGADVTADALIAAVKAAGYEACEA